MSLKVGFISKEADFISKEANLIPNPLLILFFLNITKLL